MGSRNWLVIRESWTLNSYSAVFFSCRPFPNILKYNNLVNKTHSDTSGVPVNFLRMFYHFLMYISWLPILVCIVCCFYLLDKKPDLPKLKNNLLMTNDEALTGTLHILKSSAMYESSSSQFLRTITGIQSGLNTFD